MVNATDTSYQPAVAYQGGQVNTPQQEPKSGQTQPTQAPAADTQRADQRTLASQDNNNTGAKTAKNRDSEPSQDSKSSYNDSRGTKVDVRA